MDLYRKQHRTKSFAFQCIQIDTTISFDTGKAITNVDGSDKLIKIRVDHTYIVVDLIKTISKIVDKGVKEEIMLKGGRRGMY